MASLPVVEMVTSLMYQPFDPGVPALTARPAEGPVLSTFTVRGSASVARPAALVQEPLKTAPAVSSVWCWSGVQVTGPLMASSPVVETVTSLVYQPLEPGVPAVTARAAEGPVLSTFTVSGSALVLRPAALVQEPLKTVPAVSSVWCWSAVQ